MKQALAIINKAAEEHPGFVLAYSGGSDSNVLLDLVFTQTEHLPPVVYVDSQLEYPESLDYIRSRVSSYSAKLHVSRAKITPQKQWRVHGWPFFGKQPARAFSRNHGELTGIKTDCTGCCRNLKIKPGRLLTKQLGADMQMTGVKGNADDELRGMRAVLDGAIKYVKQDRLWICNPLSGWTDTMVRRYLTQRNIPLHPRKGDGAMCIGCTVCGGGAQFATSRWRILRKTWPEAWHQFIVRDEAGYAILAAKYHKHINSVRIAVDRLGGLAQVAKDMPHVFDFLRPEPLTTGLYDR